MFCHNCGAEQPANARFCARCGTALRISEDGKASSPFDPAAAPAPPGPDAAKTVSPENVSVDPMQTGTEPPVGHTWRETEDNSETGSSAESFREPKPAVFSQVFRRHRPEDIDGLLTSGTRGREPMPTDGCPWVFSRVFISLLIFAAVIALIAHASVELGAVFMSMSSWSITFSRASFGILVPVTLLTVLWELDTSRCRRLSDLVKGFSLGVVLALPVLLVMCGMLYRGGYSFLYWDILSVFGGVVLTALFLQRRESHSVLDAAALGASIGAGMAMTAAMSGMNAYSLLSLLLGISYGGSLELLGESLPALLRVPWNSLMLGLGIILSALVSPATWLAAAAALLQKSAGKNTPSLKTCLVPKFLIFFGMMFCVILVPDLLFRTPLRLPLQVLKTAAACLLIVWMIHLGTQGRRKAERSGRAYTSADAIPFPGTKTGSGNAGYAATGPSTPNGTQYTSYPHPYHRLGGWLAFIAYGSLVAAGLMVLAAIISLVSIVGVLRAYSGYLGMLGPVIWLLYVIELAGDGFICVFGLKFFSMIRRKDPRFLRFYEIIMLVVAGLAVATAIFSGFRNVGNLVSGLLSAGIGFAIWTTYFRKSVRVRTYFGSDQYLRQSIFFKNAQAPAPADIQPYDGNR